MSFALMLVGSLACLLVAGLLGAFAWLARVERAHEEATGVLTSDRPVRRGDSGDLHLFLGFGDQGHEAVEAAVAQFGGGLVPAARIQDVAAQFTELLRSATHAHAEFSHYRAVSVRSRGASMVVYLEARVRRPIPTIVAMTAREEWASTLSALGKLGPDDVIELRFSRAVPSTDPAAPALSAFEVTPA